MRNIERKEILNVIENLKMKIDELSILSEERELTEKEQREEKTLIEALELMRLELPERPLTVQLS